MKVKVFRLEKDGLGPYRYEGGLDHSGISLLSKLHKDHSDHTNHPNAYDDFPNDRENGIKYLFGFKNLEDLKIWFRGFLTNLKKIGFKIVVYEIETRHIVHGKSGKQLIFLP